MMWKNSQLGKQTDAAISENLKTERLFQDVDDFYILVITGYEGEQFLRYDVQRCSTIPIAQYDIEFKGAPEYYSKGLLLFFPDTEDGLKKYHFFADNLCKLMYYGYARIYYNEEVIQAFYRKDYE